MPASFLQEVAYQYLTKKESLDRLGVWKRLQDATDTELAQQCHQTLGLGRSPFTEQDLVLAFRRLRVANAGDLGYFALKVLGAGNCPIRYHELTGDRLRRLITFEVFASRAQTTLALKQESTSTSSLAHIAGVGDKDLTAAPASLADIAEKYEVSLQDLNSWLAEEERALAKRQHDIRKAHQPSDAGPVVVPLH